VPALTATGAKRALSVVNAVSSPLYWLYERRLRRDILANGHLPKHIGIIMDGNRRFAKAAGLDVKAGHDYGAGKAREVLDWCLELGIKHVTLWGFSTENRGRAPEEVSHLHELFAEQIAQAITGQEVSLADAGPLPGLPHVQAALQEGRPLRILAMPPYDALIGPAIKARFPQAQCDVVTWETAGQSLAQIEAEAKARGWFAFNQNPELPRPTLAIVAVPASAVAPDFERFYRSYTWVLNWSLSFGPAQWDALAVLPEVTQPDLIDEEHERAAWALEVVLGQDIPYLTRPEGEQRGAGELLHDWLREQLQQ